MFNLSGKKLLSIKDNTTIKMIIFLHYRVLSELRNLMLVVQGCIFVGIMSFLLTSIYLYICFNSNFNLHLAKNESAVLFKLRPRVLV